MDCVEAVLRGANVLGQNFKGIGILAVSNRARLETWVDNIARKFQKP